MSESVFGPVPSRRLGKSIGINNIPPKICSYACIYCQLGRAIKMDIERKTYYNPQEVIAAVQERVHWVEQKGEKLDYLTFVPDGEATLDENLGQIIQGLKPLGYRLAIITNSSLIARQDVQDVLLQLDLVSLKIDAVSESIWRKIDHPHREIDHEKMLRGMEVFSGKYHGKLITETMLIDGVNDETGELHLLSEFIGVLNPYAAYIAIPTRSPARKDVRPASETKINEAYQAFAQKIKNVEYLIGHEGNAFAHTGNTRGDILSITAVHPMREDSVKAFLDQDGKDWSLITQLIEEGLLLETSYNGYRFYVRKLSERQQV